MSATADTAFLTVPHPDSRRPGETVRLYADGSFEEADKPAVVRWDGGVQYPGTPGQRHRPTGPLGMALRLLFARTVVESTARTLREASARYLGSAALAGEPPSPLFAEACDSLRQAARELESVLREAQTGCLAAPRAAARAAVRDAIDLLPKE
jgi:hypothetical protein